MNVIGWSVWQSIGLMRLSAVAVTVAAWKDKAFGGAVILGVVVALSACGIHPPAQDKGQQFQTSKESSATLDRVIAYPLRRVRMQGPLHYVIFRKDPQKGWQITSIDGPRLQAGLGHEELIISDDNRYIMPNYTKKNISISGETLVSMNGHMNKSYNGCNSQLVKGGVTLERLWGLIQPRRKPLSKIPTRWMKSPNAKYYVWILHSNSDKESYGDV